MEGDNSAQGPGPKYLELLQRSDATCKSLIELLANISELMRGEVSGYAKRVADYSLVLAISMGLVKPETHQIYYAGLLHEIGLFCVPPKLHTGLSDQNLTNSEKILLKQVPRMSYLCLMAVDILKPVANIVLSHQEYLNGCGYPRGLKKNQIPIASQLLAVVVDYHKIIEGKFFQEVVEPSEALSYIKDHREVLYNSEVVEKFINILSFEQQPTFKDYNPVSVAELKPGMILAKAIFSANGLELLPKCKILNQQDIDTINSVDNISDQQLEIFVMHSKSQEFDNPFTQADLDLRDISILLSD